MYLIEARSHHSVVTKGECIYVLGGSDVTGNHLKSCEMIKTTTFERKPIPPMNERRSSFAAVLLDNSNEIVVIGGENEYGSTSSVERYSLKRKVWSFLPPMNYERVNHAACVFCDKIYVFGGTFHKNSIEIFDLKTSTWSLLNETQLNIPPEITCVVPV